MKTMGTTILKTVWRMVHNQLLPNIPPNSIIVLNNTSHYSVKMERVLTLSWRKTYLQKWPSKKGVQSREDVMKAEMQVLAKKAIAAKAGHRVVRLPPSPYQYNATELIWARVKSYTSRKTNSKWLTSKFSWKMQLFILILTYSVIMEPKHSHSPAHGYTISQTSWTKCSEEQYARELAVSKVLSPNGEPELIIWLRERRGKIGGIRERSKGVSVLTFWAVTRWANLNLSVYLHRPYVPMIFSFACLLVVK